MCSASRAILPWTHLSNNQTAHLAGTNLLRDVFCSASPVPHLENGKPPRSLESGCPAWQHRHPRTTKPPTHGTCGPWDTSPATNSQGAVGVKLLPGQLSKGLCNAQKYQTSWWPQYRDFALSLLDSLWDTGLLVWSLGSVTWLFSAWSPV